MPLKRFLGKLRDDLRGLYGYPTIAAGEGMAIDYDRYWARRGGVRAGLTRHQRARAEIAARFIEPGSTVLDLGAGSGAMLAYFAKERGAHPIAVEESPAALAALRAAGIEAIAADINDPRSLAALPEVDYITGFEIIEHVPNPEALIHALGSKARKGMIFSFPNTGYYPHRLRLFFGRAPLQWIAHPGEHVRFWTVKDARWWPGAVGCQLNALVAYEGLPGLARVWPALFAEGILIYMTPPGAAAP